MTCFLPRLRLHKFLEEQSSVDDHEEVVLRMCGGLSCYSIRRSGRYEAMCMQIGTFKEEGVAIILCPGRRCYNFMFHSMCSMFMQRSGYIGIVLFTLRELA